MSRRPPRRSTLVRREAEVWAVALAMIGVVALCWVVVLAGLWVVVQSVKMGALG